MAIALNNPSAERILKTFPDFYQLDDVTRDFCNVFGYEMELVEQILHQLVEESFVVFTERYIDEWHDMFGIQINPTHSLALNRAEIISYMYARNRIRRVDIESIVRQFLDSPTTYVMQGYTNSRNIQVANAGAGFVIGDPIFIGSASALLESIDVARGILTLNQEIDTYPFAVVSQAEVEIREDFAAYTFEIVLNTGLLLDQTALEAAIERAKPAHLGYAIVETIAFDLGAFDEDAFDAS